jgi:hypothetical protein
MPLRDHFRPPLTTVTRWQALHALWPAMLLQRLNPLLPEGYRAEPSVQLGTEYEIDIGTIDARPAGLNGHPDAGGRGGTAVLTAHAPTVNVATELEEPDEASVRVYGDDGELVAAVELVSPRNKDRPDSRRDFAEKVAALVRRGVCVSVVDVVGNKHFNLYADALDLLGHTDPSVGARPPMYAATCRTVGRRPDRRFQAWSHPLMIGQPLPTVPLWLTDELSLDLNLEVSYEDAYQALRLPRAE